ncbi:MAG: metallophosphoesterase [Gemmataceae bacterium]|nr:metallophosphoesterase [Gemmataceae bacterium]MDW8242466.1 metallophosphoesterase [Thermogemmata sp.]
MRTLLVLLTTTTLLGGAVWLSQKETGSTEQAVGSAERDPIQVEKGVKNPWTHLQVNADPEQFHFAIVADRTGGHRPKIFSQAVQRINLLQPQFVISVGDLIEGYTLKEDVVNQEWNEFDGYVKHFAMPFFYVPGNHDLTNKMQVRVWEERYGRRYYSFVYKNVLFLCLNSETPPDGMGTIDPEQQKWVAQVCAAHPQVRWTFVFLHKPIWTAPDLQKNGWAAVEQALAGRKYTVFCGHVHRYQLFRRHGMEYYQLATTGGVSRLRGVEYGEFDHIAWVTMKKDRPVVAQILLEGILPPDLRVPDSDEKGVPVKKVTTYPAAGVVTLDGQPLPRAEVTLHRLQPGGKGLRAVADGWTDESGRFQLSTYSRFDGAPEGEYVVTIRLAPRLIELGGEPEKSPIPAAYGAPLRSPLRVKITPGTNELKLEVKSQP